jgi:gem associated protein 5
MSSTKSTFDMTAIWNKLSSTKVMALAWHPDKEGVLAFGTDDGRVGTVDAFSPK